jgi:EpsI family protein
MSGISSLLKSRYTLVLTLALLAQGALYYSAYGLEKVPSNRPLDRFSTNVAGWHMIEEGHIEKEIMDVLRADDTITRLYANSSNTAAASLFVAYFKTQRKGQAPHSPKNCLPGAGWTEVRDGRIDISVATEPAPVTINRYVVARGDNASVVLYWYQTRKRVIASEYAAKFWLVVDSMRLHRSDTALVKVVVPVLNGDEAAATRTAVTFVQAVFPALQEYLPT